MDFLEVGKRYRITTAEGKIYEGDFSHYRNGIPIFVFCVEENRWGGVCLWGGREIGFRADAGAVFERAQ